MGWSIGYDESWQRDIGYGVPAICDHPDCAEKIDRGLAFVCGGEPYGGEDGCGLFFCYSHINAANICKRCMRGMKPFQAKPDVKEWITHKLTDESWAEWREGNQREVERMTGMLQALSGGEPQGQPE